MANWNRKQFPYFDKTTKKPIRKKIYKNKAQNLLFQITRFILKLQQLT